MNASDIIAVVALAISALSAWVSYVAYRHSARTKDQEFELAFARQKAELLVRIDKGRKTFDALEVRMKRQHADLLAAPEAVRIALSTEVNRLASDLRHCEGCLRQAWSLWDETYETTVGGLAHHGPRFLALIEDDEEFARAAGKHCDDLDRKLAELKPEGVCIPG